MTVFVPIWDFEERIGYNDLSNVKQEDILRSDKQSENAIDTVKSDPGDNQHVVSPYITMEAHIPDLSLQPVQDQTYTSLCSFPDNMAVKIDYSCWGRERLRECSHAMVTSVKSHNKVWL